MNSVWETLHPSCLAHLVAVRRAHAGEVQLSMLREDRPALVAVLSALDRADTLIAGGDPARDSSLHIRYDPSVTSLQRILATRVDDLPLPPPRFSSERLVRACVATVWSILTADEGPPWSLPSHLRVMSVTTVPPSWEVEIALGGWRLPHHMAVTDERPPTMLELVVTGKLCAVARYDVWPGATLAGCRLVQRLWFSLSGSMVEKAVGERIIRTLLERYGHDVVHSIADRAEDVERAASRHDGDRPSGV